MPSSIGGPPSLGESGTAREKGSAVAWEGQGIFRFIFVFFSSFVSEGKTNFINGLTGTAVDPRGPVTSKDDSVRDKRVFGGRGMGVAPGYDDLGGVVPNPLLHADHAKRVPTLIVSSAEEREGKSWKTKERALGLRGCPRQKFRK